MTNFPPHKDNYAHIVDKRRINLYPMSMEKAFVFGIFVESDTAVPVTGNLAFLKSRAIMEQSRKMRRIYENH